VLSQKPAWLAGIFSGTGEQQLTHAFGKQEEDYPAGVDHLVPLKKPYGIIVQREKEYLEKP
jgi:hypothetical protein